jgi:hypothetical protein
MTAPCFPPRARVPAVLALAALLAAPAAVRAGPSEADMRFLFGYRIALACVQQDPAKERSDVGRDLASAKDFPGWPALEARPFPSCLRRHRFLDKALCDDMLATLTMKEESKDATVARVNAALQRHEAVLPQADDVLWLEDSAQEAPAAFACPEHLPHHPEHP